MTLPTGQNSKRYQATRCCRWTAAASPALRDQELRPGFTLLELLAVLVIVAVGVAMAAPTLRRFVQGRYVDDTAAQLLALAQYAQSQALAEARTYRLNFDLTERQYWLSRQIAGGFSRLASEFGRTFVIPEEVSLTWEEGPKDQDLAYIEFGPDGGTTPVRLRLVDIHGHSRTLACQAPAEGLRVLDS